MADAPAKTRTPVDFQNLTPPRSVTDPDGLKNQFKAHVHRFVDGPTEGSVVVAWKGRTPIHNEYCDVTSKEDFDAKLKEGWSAQPQLEAPKVGKGAAGKGAAGKGAADDAQS